MYERVISQAILVWTALWVIYALRSVFADAMIHTFRRGVPGPYAFGVISIVTMWIAHLMTSGQRIALDLTGRAGTPVSTTMVAHVALGLGIASGWCACRVGLTSIKWGGKPWPWRIFNIGVIALILTMVLFAWM